MDGRAMVAVVVAAATLAGSAQGAGADRSTEPAWMRALWIRSAALNEMYGLGEYRREAARPGEPPWERALRVCGEAMNRGA